MEEGIRGIVVAQDHYILNGLSSAVSEVLTGSPVIDRYVPVETIGLKGFGQSGSPSDLVEHYELAAKHIGLKISKVLERAD